MFDRHAESLVMGVQEGILREFYIFMVSKKDWLIV